MKRECICAVLIFPGVLSGCGISKSKAENACVRLSVANSDSEKLAIVTDLGIGAKDAADRLSDYQRNTLLSFAVVKANGYSSLDSWQRDLCIASLQGDFKKSERLSNKAVFRDGTGGSEP